MHACLSFMQHSQSCPAGQHMCPSATGVLPAILQAEGTRLWPPQQLVCMAGVAVWAVRPSQTPICLSWCDKFCIVMLPICWRVVCAMLGCVCALMDMCVWCCVLGRLTVRLLHLAVACSTLWQVSSFAFNSLFFCLPQPQATHTHVACGEILEHWQAFPCRSTCACVVYVHRLSSCAWLHNKHTNACVASDISGNTPSACHIP